MIEEKNKSLNTLVCLLDGKITVYRMNNPNKDNTDIINVQKELYKIWNRINKEV